MKDRVIVFLDEKDPLADHVALLLNDALEGRDFNVDFFNEDLLQGHKGKRPARYIAIFSRNFLRTAQNIHEMLWQLVLAEALVPVRLDGVKWASDEVGQFSRVWSTEMSGVTLRDDELSEDLVESLVHDLLDIQEISLRNIQRTR